jgi:hypothetical protein
VKVLKEEVNHELAQARSKLKKVVIACLNLRFFMHIVTY